MAGTRTTPFIKDPDDIATYGINWASKLAELTVPDTLDTSAWAVVSGTVIIDTNTSNTTIALVTLSGGTLGERCELRNRVTTAQGQRYDKTIYVLIVKR